MHSDLQPPLLPEVSSAESPQTVVQSRRGCLPGFTGCLLVLAVALAVILLIATAGFENVVNGINSTLDRFMSPAPPQAHVVTTQTIVQGIQPMGQLVSISSQLAKADIFVGIQQGALNACGFGANHVAQGTIEAGIDLTRVTANDVTYNAASDTYTLTLPSAQLTSCRVDFIRQYDRTSTACSVDWDQARLLANYTSLVEFRDDALSGGILDRAQQEARLVLGNFVELLTGSNVEITFRTPDGTAALPPSCQPQPPPGWTFNPETGAWVRQ